MQAATDTATTTVTGGSSPLEDPVSAPVVDSKPLVLSAESPVVLETVTAEVEDPSVVVVVHGPEEPAGPVPGTTVVVPGDEDAEPDPYDVEVPASGSTQASENAAGANSPYRRPLGHVSSGKLQWPLASQDPPGRPEQSLAVRH